MAAVYDWTVPFMLTTPRGTLGFNQLVTVGTTPLGYFVLDKSACDSGPAIRAPRDDLPQASGEIKHNHFKTGYVMNLTVQLWETIGADGQPAWREKLVQMGDLLQNHLNSIVGDNTLVLPGAEDGRIQWSPAGSPVDRMLHPVRMLELPTFSQGDELTTVKFSLVTDRPYAWDAPEVTTCVGTTPNCTGPNPNTLTNEGTSNFYGFVHIYGPFNTFAIVNNSIVDQNGQPLQLAYDASFPGANSVGSGHYLEIDFWRNTVYLDGNVANYKPGIDIAVSDFFPLQPGDNIIELTGGYTGTGAEFHWQNAWA